MNILVISYLGQPVI